MKRFITTLILLGLISVVIPDTARCIQTEFSGRAQSTCVLRDFDGGFSRGFYDSSKGVQWRNELKFDLYVRPDTKYWEPPNIHFEKLFLSYRGAYDAIFETTDRYDHAEDKELGDWELGKDDIEWENDLREAFVDFVADYGNMVTTLRVGKQIVQWGEADVFNMINIVNPTNLSWQMFFSPPEDTAEPLWMARLNQEIRDIGPVRTLGFEFLAIPNVAPFIHAPLTDQDGNFDSTVSPYGFLFSDFDGYSEAFIRQAFGSAVWNMLTPAQQTALGMSYEEDIPAQTFENMEYGIRLDAETDLFTASLYYLVHHQDNPAVDLTDLGRFAAGLGGWLGAGPFPTGLVTTWRHPRCRSYGLSFNTYNASIDTVIRGEAVLTDSQYLMDIEGLLVTNMLGYSKHKVYEYMIGFDKDFKQWDWTGTISNWSMSFQAYWKHINDFEDDISVRWYHKRNSFLFTYQVFTDYCHGKIKPMLNVSYDPEGKWNIRPSVTYEPNHEWFFTFTMMTFLGNRNHYGPFSDYMMENGSESSLRIGYRF